MTIANDTVLQVDGMTCANCVRHVREALTAVPGVREVDVKLDQGLATVRHEGAAIEQLVDAVREAGYEARPRAGV